MEEHDAGRLLKLRMQRDQLIEEQAEHVRVHGRECPWKAAALKAMTAALNAYTHKPVWIAEWTEERARIALRSRLQVEEVKEWARRLRAENPELFERITKEQSQWRDRTS